jgi:BON domain-containing protein
MWWHDECYFIMGIFRVALLFLVATIGVAGGQEQVPAPATPGETRAPADEATEAAVARVLEDDPHVHAMKMKVAVWQGVVTLTGSAESVAEKDTAEATVRRVAGVRDVENKLVVDPPGEPAPGASMIPEVPAH